MNIVNMLLLKSLKKFAIKLNSLFIRLVLIKVLIN